MPRSFDLEPVPPLIAAEPVVLVDGLRALIFVTRDVAHVDGLWARVVPPVASNGDLGLAALQLALWGGVVAAVAAVVAVRRGARARVCERGGGIYTQGKENTKYSRPAASGATNTYPPPFA